MIRFITMTLLVFVCSCEAKHTNPAHTETTEVKPVVESGLAKTNSTDSIEADSLIDAQTVTCYVVIADTGTDYFELRKKMFSLNGSSKISIDTMGRFYNLEKNLIALPEDDPDEIYSGDYIPRRVPSENLSLEYLSFYQPSPGEGRTIALVTGIYTTLSEAKASLESIKRLSPNAFMVRSDIYMGCIH